VGKKCKPKEERIDEEDNYDEELATEEIARLVKEGYTSGVEPSWSIDYPYELRDDDVALNEIARLIREGYTSGYEPQFDLHRE